MKHSNTSNSRAADFAGGYRTLKQIRESKPIGRTRTAHVYTSMSPEELNKAIEQAKRLPR